jgi:predicted nucleic acid-binding protein
MADDPAAAPTLWRLEVANVLLMAERRGRIAPVAGAGYLRQVDEFPVLVEDHVADLDVLLALSRRHDLTIYDSSYLELAIRLGRPLATLDRRLAAAARAEGVPVLA